MNFISANLLSFKIGAIALLLSGLLGYHAYKVHAAREDGRITESARRDILEQAASSQAKSLLLEANGRVRVAQTALAVAQDALDKLSLENSNEKIKDAQHIADLASGRERMRITTHLQPRIEVSKAGPSSDAATPAVDSGASVDADVDPAVAAGIDSIRTRYNEAVRRLNACIVAYDSAKAASDAQ